MREKEIEKSNLLMTDGEKELPPTFGMTEELSTDEVNKGRKHYLEMCRERDAKLKIYRDKRKARELKKIDAIRADQEDKTRREIGEWLWRIVTEAGLSADLFAAIEKLKSGQSPKEV